tara:strand:+ start:44352 stop:44591 length:240 start_codon:yes stop_codon:yes gene_type:complete
MKISSITERSSPNTTTAVTKATAPIRNAYMSIKAAKQKLENDMPDLADPNLDRALVELDNQIEEVLGKCAAIYKYMQKK